MLPSVRELSQFHGALTEELVPLGNSASEGEKVELSFMGH
jgi:hypothetical protein